LFYLAMVGIPVHVVAAGVEADRSAANQCGGNNAKR
jgi:hypothetical protein